ncbi:integrin alpha-4-like [Stegodyphus dumicola]|uniref:integrin alpha-4-like n=1 Tax=Stegodyphus dumicola TaxID=202533 RepID=UPI0015AE93DA|nr:integrin alpha-4-like [Stegodyphus dumicola]
MIIFSSTAGIKFFSCLVQLVIFSRISGYNLDTKFPIFYESLPGNYFGYSVALHRNRDGPMALIGAPRANSSVLGNQLHEPGVIYRCAIANYSICTEVILDRKGNTQSDRGNDFSYYDKKDNMWLGVSLDIQQNGGQNDIVACGHLWKNQFYRQHYLTNGVCYVIDRELDPSSVTKLVPFVDKSKQSLQSKIYYFAFGQVGTSATYSEDGKHLLLGAPGFYDWTGTVVNYPINYTRFYDQYRDPIIPDPPVDQNPESYMGYSITSGKFYDNNETYAAVGAPRDGDSHGRVFIFKPTKSPSNKLLVHQKKEGTQFGEYFGAAVLGVNLNGDRYADLLVGAPFSSSDSGGDEGKVYVYISNGMGLQLFAELFGDNKPSARFGSAIANVGDLNQDGYNDVAIGAPYEDKNGAVYIYHGSSVGIYVLYVQKISASSISPTLSGFGIQISRGLDIDSNQYPDMLVGAYASSNAVLFRAQPVIQLFAKLTFLPKQINTNVTACEFQGKNVTCVNVTACLWYAGKHVPLYLEFENDLFVEHPSLTNVVTPRGFFHRNNKAVHSVKQKMNLSIGITECIREVLYIRPDIKDVITPIQLLYRYNLTEAKEKNVEFNKHYPIIDPASPTNITSAITFQTGCGKDDKCLSNLVVKAEIIDKHK